MCDELGFPDRPRPATAVRRLRLCVARDPGMRLGDIASSLGITERSAHGFVTNLIAAGYLVNAAEPLPCPLHDWGRGSASRPCLTAAERHKGDVTQAHPSVPGDADEGPGMRWKVPPQHPINVAVFQKFIASFLEPA
jgi:hypothetical protein